MKNTLIALAILLASCTNEKPYFIESSINKELIDGNLKIKVESSATEGVNKVEVIYMHFLSSGETTQSIDYINPIENQVSTFTIDRARQIDTIYVVVTDSKGHYKTFNL